MAHAIQSDSTGKYVVVVSGDTLSEIAIEADVKAASGNKTYQQLATLNGIQNANLIYPNQKIYLTKEESGSSGSSSSTNSNAPTVTAFGEQSTASGTLFATWTWGQHNVTAKYETWWEYDKGDVDYNGKTIWYIDKGSADERQTTWSIPSGAKSVKFYVKPISQTKDDGKTTFFTGDWSTVKVWNIATPIVFTTVPTVEMDGCTLTASLNNLDVVGATHISFEVVKDNNTYFAKNCDVQIVTGFASYTWTVDPGAVYKVRCYAFSKKANGFWSDWTAYSNNYPSTPTPVSKFSSIRVTDKNSVILEWSESKTAESYEIEWYDDKENIGLADPTGSKTISDQLACKINDLASGYEYFFRIRAKNEEGESDWSEIASIIVGTTPSAPTTWSSTTTVIAGEDLVLYWVHNSEDNSSQTRAVLKLDITVDGSITSYPEIEIENVTDDKLKDKTSSCTINTTTGIISWVEDDGEHTYFLGVTFKENVKINWQVKTKGIKDEYSEYSTRKEINVYSTPNLELHLGTAKYYLVEESGGIYTKTDEAVTILIGTALTGVFTTNGEQVYRYADATGAVTYYCCEITEFSLDSNNVADKPMIESFPFYVSALPGPKSQSPISYHLSVSADTAYETSDELGNFKMVNAGEQVYSQFFDVKYDLLVEFSPGNIDLENNISYTIKCVVSMDSGLTAEASQGFTVSWSEMKFVPNAEIGIDTTSMTASIRPYCADRKMRYRKVEIAGTEYIAGDILPYDFLYGEPIGTVTTTGEPVYIGYPVDNSDTIYFCEVEASTPVTDVYLAVYRREFDGSFTELATMLDGAINTAITDPHPALDYARYRIVAISKTTGAVGYADLPGVPVNGKAVIIQWNEAWSSFEATNESYFAEPTWTGSMLKLPYNIDVSDNANPEVELVQYIGRKHPVTYYGTQRGHKSTWNVTIPKNDEETLYGLRRLSMWMEDVYVREPSGSGYWANIKVSFSQKHKDLTIPVTLSVTRVEGGI